MTILPLGVRHAFRRWRHQPDLAIAATVVPAVGVGATTAKFCISAQ